MNEQVILSNNEVDDLHAGLVRLGLASGIQGRWGGGTFIIAVFSKN